LKGVVRVIVGYTGGIQPNPVYRNIQDATEALWIEFNPQKVSYWKVLELWHDNTDLHSPPPEQQQRLCQYRTAIWWTSTSQQQAATQFGSSGRVTARSSKNTLCACRTGKDLLSGGRISPRLSCQKAEGGRYQHVCHFGVKQPGFDKESDLTRIVQAIGITEARNVSGSSLNDELVL
jgi:hypothetical protein